MKSAVYLGTVGPAAMAGSQVSTHPLAKKNESGLKMRDKPRRNSKASIIYPAFLNTFSSTQHSLPTQISLLGLSTILQLLKVYHLPNFELLIVSELIRAAKSFLAKHGTSRITETAYRAVGQQPGKSSQPLISKLDAFADAAEVYGC